MKPHVITFLAPKGGAGRTTAVMALASAIVDTGSYRPLVIDASREIAGCRRGSTLSIWHRMMQRCGVKEDQIEYRQAATREELARIIQAEADKGPLMRSPVLIDTSARLDDLDLAAADHADVILSPFMDALAAQRISVALDPLDVRAPIYGLRCGHAFDDSQARAVSAAFTVGRLLQHGLPESEILSEISIGGHVPHMCMKFAIEPQGEPLASRIPSLRPIYAMQSELRKLVNEVMLALDGYELRPRHPKARRHPLPLHKLAELLPT
ncbi:hypothetical protein GCM10007385_19960 [Tateyamaria omphalii]|uniref:ParA family protein n=1 Tax=Tateyamaria omphalii TaxID=299262 RepID=UPI00167BB999|nr:ParA family protein [Tateyamaria omphalii]GGX51357.1 hypothetical protein GCM10007385_19960 [Tateyamaria omphalii]